MQEGQSLALCSLVMNRLRPWLHSSGSVTGSALGLRVEGPLGRDTLRPPVSPAASLHSVHILLGRSCKELARKLVLGSSQALPRHMLSQPTLWRGLGPLQARVGASVLAAGTSRAVDRPLRLGGEETAGFREEQSEPSPHTQLLLPGRDGPYRM